MQLLNQQQSNSVPNGIFNLINSIRTAQNPDSMLKQLAATNPQIQEVMHYVQDNGGNARQAFYNLAQQRGIDPQTILDQLK